MTMLSPKLVHNDGNDNLYDIKCIALLNKRIIYERFVSLKVWVSLKRYQFP